jgi:hypothetical protein
LPGLPTNDDLVSGNKQLLVTLTLQTNVDIVSASFQQANITINDIDTTTFSWAQNYVVNEGVGSFSATVNRTGPATNPASVQVSTINGSATAPSDFTAIPPTTINFAANQTSKSFTVFITDDSVVEPQESFFLRLSNPLPAGTAGGDATVTINDDDGAGSGVIQFQSATYTGNEADLQAVITLIRTGSTAGTVTVYCTTAGGTATPTADYTSGSFLATFNNGFSTATCSIPLVNDGIADSGETVGLQLTGLSSGATYGAQNAATLTIFDNNSGLGTVQFASAAYAGYENNGTAVIGLTRTVSTLGQVTVYCTTLAGGTATANVDYTAGSYPATFADGATTATCSIPLTNDFFSEPLGETVNLGLTGISGGATYGFQQLATLTIYDGTGSGVTITSLTPNSGPTAGGNVVAITGTNLVNATSVTFGGISAAILTNNGVQITVTAPFHTAGTVDVVVNTPQGSSGTAGTLNDYTYTDGPAITNVTPNTGPASGVPTTFVTITGANFIPGGAGMTVKFGGTATANFNVTDANTIIVIAPAHTAGTVDIVVTTPGGTSPITVNDQFTYTGSSAPVVSSISPSSGATGTVITITGSGFTGVICPAGVTFGGVSATSCTVNSDTSITATVPAGAPGGVSDVRVTNAIGTSTNTTADNFNNTTNTGATITYTLVSRFTLIGWSGIDNISAAAALRGQETPDNPLTNDVSGIVTVIWRFDTASQSYKGYFPGSENVPGANDFTTLQKGVGYFIAINVATANWTVIEG